MQHYNLMRHLFQSVRAARKGVGPSIPTWVIISMVVGVAVMVVILYAVTSTSLAVGEIALPLIQYLSCNLFA